MSLTPAQQRHVMQWFQAKAGKCKCPVCRKCSWKVETSAALPEVWGRAATAPNSSIEVVLVICVNCSHYLLFGGSILDTPIPTDES
jgi:hypothetical protein